MDLATRIIVHPPVGIPRALLVGFLSRTRGSLSNLRAVSENREYDAVRVFGHRLKGSGGAYGIPRLTELGAAIERAGKNQESDELPRLVASLDAYLGQLEVAEA